MSAYDEILIRIRAIGAAAAAGEVGDAEGAVGSLGKTAKFAAGVAGLGALAFGLKDITAAAVSFQTQSQLTAQALRNTGQYSQQNLTQLTEFADRLATHGGYDPTTTLSGLQRLIAAHDSVAQAMRDELLVSDIARSGAISYSSALRAVSVIEQGRTTGLSRLGVVAQAVNAAEDRLRASHQQSVDVLAELTAQGVKFSAAQRLQYEQTHQLTPEMLAQAKAQDANATKLAVLNLLWHRFGGNVAAFSGSPAGAISNFRNQIDILGQRLGKFLLPAISEVIKGLIVLVGWGVQAADWLGKNQAVAVILGSVLAGVAIALWGAAAAGAVWNLVLGAMFVVSQAILALPYILVFAAIVAGLYELITHFGDVKNAVVDAWHWIETAFVNVYNWLNTAWRDAARILAFPFQWAWNNVLKPSFAWLMGAFHDVKSWVSGAWRDLVDAIEWPFKKAFGFIKDIYDHTIRPIIDVVRSVVGGGDTSAPVPRSQYTPAVRQLHPDVVWHIKGSRAMGGPSYDTGSYLVGERGPELVSLPAGASVTPNDKLDLGSPREITVTIPIENTIQVDYQTVAKVMTRAVRTLNAAS